MRFALERFCFGYVGELCHTLIEVTTSISHDPQSPNSRDVQLLPKLSQAILAGFNPARDESVMAGEISEMVGKFAERANADALRRAAKRSQSMIDAQWAEEEQSKEREAEDRGQKNGAARSTSRRCEGQQPAERYVGMARTLRPRSETRYSV